MITLNKINKVKEIDFLNNMHYDAFFHGKAIDERTRFVIGKIVTPKVYSISFNKDNLLISINSDEVKLLKFHEHVIFKTAKNILIDSTSLDFPELLYLLYALNSTTQDICITVIYIEPASYTKKDSIMEEDDEFNLSEGMSNFSGLPLFSINNRQNNKEKNILLSFLGFENSRLGQILESDDGATFGKLLAFVAVPAYQPGWENNSLRKHLSYFEQFKTDLMLYPGNNPYDVIKKLTTIYSAYSNIVIAAIGTKPSTLASAIFLANNVKNNSINQQIGTIYDYPIKSKDRSVGIGCISLYELNKSI